MLLNLVQITCSVRARTENTVGALSGNTMRQSFFIGAVIPDESLFITLEEDGTPSQYHAKFTIPIR